MRARSWIAASVISLMMHASALYALAAIVKVRAAPAWSEIEFAGDDAGFKTAVAESVVTATAAVSGESNSLTESDQSAIATEVAEPGSAISVTSDDTAQAGSMEANAAGSESTAVTADTDIAPAVPISPVAQGLADSPEAVTEPDEHLAEEPVEVETTLAPSDSSFPASQVEGQVAGETIEQPQDAMPVNTASAAVTVNPDQPSASVPSSPVASSEPAAPAAAEAAVADIADDTAQAATVTESKTTQLDSGDSSRQEFRTALLPPRPNIPSVKKDYRKAIASFFQAYDSGSCFLVLPISIDADGASVSGIGSDSRRFQLLQQQFSRAVNAPLAVDINLIDPLQCSTVDIAKAFASASGPALALALEDTDLPDGTELVAEIRNIAKPWLSVFVVDDEGMIRDVSDRVSQVSGKLILRAPVRLSGEGQNKNQLLIAVSSSKPFDMLNFQGRRPAYQILPMAIGERKVKGLATDVAIAVFRVR